MRCTAVLQKDTGPCEVMEPDPLSTQDWTIPGTSPWRGKSRMHTRIPRNSLSLCCQKDRPGKEKKATKNLTGRGGIANNWLATKRAVEEKAGGAASRRAKGTKRNDLVACQKKQRDSGRGEGGATKEMPGPVQPLQEDP